MRNSRAPLRITLLQQGSKLGPKGTAKGMKLGNVWWGKNRNDFYVNFARACQDHTFAARIQVGTPRDSQMNETGKSLMGKKTETIFMWILRAPVRITLLQQGSKLGHQGTAKAMKLGNVWWVKKQKRLLCEFCSRLSGSHFCSKDPSWDTKGQPNEWKWKMSDG